MTKKAMIDELVKYGVIEEEARSTYMRKGKDHIEILTRTALPIRKEYLKLGRNLTPNEVMNILKKA